MHRTPQSITQTMDLVADLTATQQAVLEVLGRAPGPLNVTEIAELVDLHTNTVREVLTHLLGRQLVTRERETGGGRGRPFWLYSACVNGDPKQIVRELASFGAAVAEQIEETMPDPRPVAVGLGRSWAKQILADLTASGELETPWQDTPVAGDADSEEAGEPSPEQVRLVAEIRRFLSRLGFEARQGRGWREVELYQCPLLREGTPISPLLCDIHQGMTDELVAGLTGGQCRSHLTPFAGRGHCQVLLLPQRQ